MSLPDSPSRQLPLSIRLDDSATFGNFYSVSSAPSTDGSVSPDSNDANTQALKALQSLSPGALLYLWGQAGAGCSHLLQAVCHEFQSQSIYLPLDQLSDEDPAEVLSAIEQMPVVALDHLDAVIEEANWSEQLFHLYNRILEVQTVLIVAGRHAPMALKTPLADLKSRLSAMQVHRLNLLSDEDKIAALVLRATNRGMAMPNNVAQYLLTHFSREMSEQIELLDLLDRVSLEEQRKLSIPLVKQAIAAN